LKAFWPIRIFSTFDDFEWSQLTVKSGILPN
jgi:hypothetical protein